jgi:hypothetical protein
LGEELTVDDALSMPMPALVHVEWHAERWRIKPIGDES